MRNAIKSFAITGRTSVPIESRPRAKFAESRRPSAANARSGERTARQCFLARIRRGTVASSLG